MKEFKIRFHSGLGDCLRMLTEQPAIKLVRKIHGLKIHWVYDTAGLASLSTRHSNYPLHLVLYEIFQNVDFLNPVSQEEYTNLQVPELTNWRGDYDPNNQLRGLYPGIESPGFDIPLPPTDMREVRHLIGQYRLSFCVQVTGKDERKRYSTDNYITLFNLILDKYQDSSILLIDTPDRPVDKTLLFDQRIIDLTSTFTLTQQIEVIRLADYLIAPISYSKYVRRWVNGKQTILCSTLDYISNKSLLTGCFGDYRKPYTAGLLFNPAVTLLGVKHTGELDNLEIVDNINNILPSDVFKSITLNI